MPSIMKMFGLAYDETIYTRGNSSIILESSNKVWVYFFFNNGTTWKRLFMVLGASKKDLNLMWPAGNMVGAKRFLDYIYMPGK